MNNKNITKLDKNVAILIGSSHYKESEVQKNYSIPFVKGYIKAFYDILINNGFEKGDINILIDLCENDNDSCKPKFDEHFIKNSNIQQVTRWSIISKLFEVINKNYNGQKVNLLIYFIGHGGGLKSDYFYYPSDSIGIATRNLEIIEQTSISYFGLLRLFETSKIIKGQITMIVDSCLTSFSSTNYQKNHRKTQFKYQNSFFSHPTTNIALFFATSGEEKSNTYCTDDFKANNKNWIENNKLGDYVFSEKNDHVTERRHFSVFSSSLLIAINEVLANDHVNFHNLVRHTINHFESLKEKLRDGGLLKYTQQNPFHYASVQLNSPDHIIIPSNKKKEKTKILDQAILDVLRDDKGINDLIKALGEFEFFSTDSLSEVKTTTLIKLANCINGFQGNYTLNNILKLYFRIICDVLIKRVETACNLCKANFYYVLMSYTQFLQNNSNNSEALEVLQVYEKALNEDKTDFAEKETLEIEINEHKMEVIQRLEESKSILIDLIKYENLDFHETKKQNQIHNRNLLWNYIIIIFMSLTVITILFQYELNLVFFLTILLLLLSPLIYNLFSKEKLEKFYLTFLMYLSLFSLLLLILTEQWLCVNFDVCISKENISLFLLAIVLFNLFTLLYIFKFSKHKI
jgi:hypothetical protein